jgi:hypothetical protein
MLGQDEFALIRSAVERYEPQLTPLLAELGHRRLTVFERDGLRVALEQELVERGVDERDEPTAYGQGIERVIAALDDL